MPGRRRSGLARDRRAYNWLKISDIISPPSLYTVTYDGNTNTSGNAPTNSSSPYIAGSTVTILGNSGSPVFAKSGYTFDGWNTAADGLGTSYSQGNTFIINANTILYAKWAVVPAVSTPTALSSVGGNQCAYILFTQGGSAGTVTNYEYSTDDGATFRAFTPAQQYSPVEITALSSDGTTPLTNGTEYTVKLKAVNSSGVTSSESAAVNVTPTVTTLESAGRIIYLDANNTSSYAGSGATTWTNLDSEGDYNATLNGSPTFNTTDANNKYIEFNPGEATGQFAQINQATDINPVLNQPFTIQMWVKINNVGSQGSLVSKAFGGPSYDGYAVGYRADNTLELHENGTSKVSYYKSAPDVVNNGWRLYTANIQFGNGGERMNKVFVNGRQVLTRVITNNQEFFSLLSNETGIPSSTQNMTFATGFYGESECDIGQFYYYNTELTTTQIIQNYDATKSRYVSS
jgi:uncharacterized repeat protein (TIGR02543 family)